MLLKIFVKRKTHGELCNAHIKDDVEGETIVEEFHEASEIRKIITKNGFLFKMNGVDFLEAVVFLSAASLPVVPFDFFITLIFKNLYSV